MALPKKGTGSGTKAYISTDGSEFTQFLSVSKVSPPDYSRGTVDLTDNASYDDNNQMKEFGVGFIEGGDLKIEGWHRTDDTGITAAEEAFFAGTPVQIKLVPVNAPFFRNCDLLIAADCTAFACGGFHDRFLRNRVLLIGCTKLDGVDYAEKLAEIIRNNAVRSVTVVRMEVPCCGGIEYAVKKALQSSGKFIPWNVVTISTDGRILNG